jgi:hypothetical protein
VDFPEKTFVILVTTESKSYYQSELSLVLDDPEHISTINYNFKIWINSKCLWYGGEYPGYFYSEP